MSEDDRTGSPEANAQSDIRRGDDSHSGHLLTQLLSQLAEMQGQMSHQYDELYSCQMELNTGLEAHEKRSASEKMAAETAAPASRAATERAAFGDGRQVGQPPWLRGTSTGYRRRESISPVEVNWANAQARQLGQTLADVTRSVRLQETPTLVSGRLFKDFKASFLSYLGMKAPALITQAMMGPNDPDLDAGMQMYLFNLLFQITQKHTVALSELTLLSNQNISNKGAVAWHKLNQKLDRTSFPKIVELLTDFVTKQPAGTSMEEFVSAKRKLISDMNDHLGYVDGMPQLGDMMLGVLVMGLMDVSAPAAATARSIVLAENNMDSHGPLDSEKICSEIIFQTQNSSNPTEHGLVLLKSLNGLYLLDDGQTSSAKAHVPFALLASQSWTMLSSGTSA
eukprot:jgi/Tetstr1/464804/TSEL_009543.t1